MPGCNLGGNFRPNRLHGRGGPTLVSVPYFFADNLAWAMACPMITTKE